MWPIGTQLEFTVTTLGIGLPRRVVVQRCRREDVDPVLRDDGECDRRLAQAVQPTPVRVARCMHRERTGSEQPLLAAPFSRKCLPALVEPFDNDASLCRGANQARRVTKNMMPKTTRTRMTMLGTFMMPSRLPEIVSRY